MQRARFAFSVQLALALAATISTAWPALALGPSDPWGVAPIPVQYGRCFDSTIARLESTGSDAKSGAIKVHFANEVTATVHADDATYESAKEMREGDRVQACVVDQRYCDMQHTWRVWDSQGQPVRGPDDIRADETYYNDDGSPIQLGGRWEFAWRVYDYSKPALVTARDDEGEKRIGSARAS